MRPGRSPYAAPLDLLPGRNIISSMERSCHLRSPASCALAFALAVTCGAQDRRSADPPTAAALARAGKWREAEAAWRQFLNAQPSSVPAALGHIRALVHLDHAVEASQELKRLLEAHPDEPAVLREYAFQLSTLDKNPVDAERVLERITVIAPDDAEAWALLGSFHLGREHAARAGECFSRAAGIEPANPVYRAGLARANSLAGKDAEAEREFRAALASARPASHPAAFKWYAEWQAASGRLDESRAAYTKALEGEPSNPSLLLARAAVLTAAGKYADAEADIREARRLGASERESLNAMVRIYKGLGEQAKAAEAAAAVARAAELEEQRRANWRAAKADLDIAEKLMASGRAREALPLFLRVTSAAPGYADAWFGAAACYSASGDAVNAERYMREFLRLQPLSAEGHSALGIMLLEQGRTGEARTELEEAIRLDPSSSEAREALRALESKGK